MKITIFFVQQFEYNDKNLHLSPYDQGHNYTMDFKFSFNFFLF
jgi:hypothetical protein